MPGPDAAVRCLPGLHLEHSRILRHQRSLQVLQLLPAVRGGCGSGDAAPAGGRDAGDGRDHRGAVRRLPGRGVLFLRVDVQAAGLFDHSRHRPGHRRQHRFLDLGRDVGHRDGLGIDKEDVLGQEGEIFLVAKLGKITVVAAFILKSDQNYILEQGEIFEEENKTRSGTEDAGLHTL